MTLQAQLEALRDNTLKEIAQVATLKELNQIRVETLGKKGPITEVLRGMKNLSPEERPVVGGFANEIRDLLTEAIEARKRRKFRCNFTWKTNASRYTSYFDTSYGRD